MFGTASISALAVAAITIFSASTDARPIPHSVRMYRRWTFRAQPAPANWATSQLEDYDNYHFRYLAVSCHTQHDSAFFEACCHPRRKTQSDADFPAQCSLDASSVAAAAQIVQQSVGDAGSVNKTSQAERVFVKQGVVAPFDALKNNAPPSDAQLAAVQKVHVALAKAADAAESPKSAVSAAVASASASASAADKKVAPSTSSSADPKPTGPSPAQVAAAAAASKAAEAKEAAEAKAADAKEAAQAKAAEAAKEAQQAKEAAQAKAAQDAKDAKEAAEAKAAQAAQAVQAAKQKAEQEAAEAAAAAKQKAAAVAAAAAKQQQSSSDDDGGDDSGSSSGGGGGGSGTTYSGMATFFFQKGVAGNCGKVNSDSTPLVALDSAMYSNGKYCGQKVIITRPSTGKSITAVVADQCPTCVSSGSLDLSTGAYDQLGSVDEGTFPIKWQFAN